MDPGLDFLTKGRKNISMSYCYTKSYKTKFWTIMYSFNFPLTCVSVSLP